MWLRNLFLFLSVALLAGCEKPKLPSPFHANDISVMFTEADFHLTDHNGKPRSLADFRGKVVALFFGYTGCPDVCPTTLADLAQAKKLLGKDADRVQVLFVTVDPERDRPEMMAKYVPAFDPSFLGLYGDAQATAQAAKAFYVTYQKQSSESGYNMDHSLGTFLVDPKGKVRLRAPHAQRAEWLADDIRLLLGGA
ncbi:MAG: SCO family protein [Gallionella sp.]|nr:MAG: SCO family protein [Gallionella sp.]